MPEIQVSPHPLDGYVVVSPGTSAVRQDDTWEITIPPFGKKLCLSTDSLRSGIDWNALSEPLDATERLYLSSGHFLLLMDRGDERDDAITGFLSWVQSGDVRSRWVSSASWDHSTAMRLEMCCLLYSSVTGEAAAAVLRQLRADLTWACVPMNSPLNNHGVFLLQALLFVRGTVTHHPELLATLGGQQLIDQIDAAVSIRLPQILELVYGDDGWCGENSPLYDRVWINLLNKLLRFFPTELAEIGLLEIIREIVQQSDETSRFLLLPGGHYVPRGDTQRLQTKLLPNKGTRHNTRVGIWVHSDQELYLLATCGYASHVHKHVDDTQLLVTYRGVDFFTDAGYHSANYKDPRIPALRSAFGHSVLGLYEVDAMTPWLAYPIERRRQVATMTDASDEGVLMTRLVDGNQRLSRRVKLTGGTVQVEDRWDLADGGSPMARFLLPEGCVLRIGPQELVIDRLGQRLTMTFTRPIEATVTTGEEQAPYRGWYSPLVNVLLPGHCLEVVPVGAQAQDAMQYTLSFQTPDAPEGH